MTTAHSPVTDPLTTAPPAVRASAARHQLGGSRSRTEGAGFEESGRFPVVKAALFVAGCVLLVLAAANLSNLGQWSQRWGQIPVFLAFFLVMSVAGRWFWTGADAIVARVIGHR